MFIGENGSYIWPFALMIGVWKKGSLIIFCQKCSRIYAISHQILSWKIIPTKQNLTSYNSERYDENTQRNENVEYKKKKKNERKFST